MTPYTANDLEADIRAAMDANDWLRVEQLHAELDRIDKPTASLHAAALWYAEQGLHVFPLSPGSKIPFKATRGCKDATLDTEQITAWWTINPDANIGIATGYLVDVVDIDGHLGQQSRRENWCNQCDAPICDHTGSGTTFVNIERLCVGKVFTPRHGGMHLYIAAQGDQNRAGILPGIDYRGLGGYVVAPPSITPDGAYIWATALDLDHVPERI